MTTPKTFDGFLSMAIIDSIESRHAVAVEDFALAPLRHAHRHAVTLIPEPDDMGELREAVETLTAKLSRAHAALRDVEAALEEREDADCMGDPPEYVPNWAMRLLETVRGGLL